MALIADFIMQGVQMLLVLAIAPGIIGLVRKAKARLLMRQGPSVLQPYRDLARLMRKEVLLAHNASWLFRVAPYVIFAAVWIAAALTPTFATGLMFNWTADLVAIVALLAMARFAQALAGMDVGTPFGGLGSSREMMIAALAEPAMLMIVFTTALLAGTTQLSQIAAYLASQPLILRASLALTLIALVLVSLAENARIPVDNPATHLELTMVHEAMVLEYSGRHLALIEAASAVKLVFYFSLIACLFFPFGIAAEQQGLGAQVLGMLLWGVKMVIFALLLALGETMIAKMRLFRVPEMLGGALVLGLISMVLLFVSGNM